MKTSKKVALIVAAFLFVCGAVLSAVGFSMGAGAEKTYGPSAECQESSFTVSELFYSVSVDTDECDVSFFQSTNGSCRVTCYAPEGVEHIVAVEEGMLTVREMDTRAWYEKWGIWNERVHMEIYLPQMTGAELSITTDTGDVSLPSWLSFTAVKVGTHTGDVAAQGVVAPKELLIMTNTGDVALQACEAIMLNVTTNTGDVTLADCHSDTLGAHTGTGDVQLRRSVAGHVGITTDTGDVALQAVGAEEMEIETVTGDVTGTLLSDKVFEVRSSTGDVSVPASVAGAGKCAITTSTGDINLRIE